MKNSLKKQKKTRKHEKLRMAVTSTASKKEYKQSKTKSNKLGKFFMIVMALIILFVFLFVSGIFELSEIIVENNHTISTEQIIRFSEVEKGTNIFAISKKEVIKKLKEHAYINEVKIKKVLPNKLKIIVDERKVKYALQLASSYVYINEQGYVLEISNTLPKVPLIVGLTTDLSNVKENDRLTNEDLKKLNTVMKIMQIATNNDLADLITKLDVSNEKDYLIYLDTEGKIAYLGEGTELNTRFLYIKAILKEQQGKQGEIFVNTDLNSEYVYFRENVPNQ